MAFQEKKCRRKLIKLTPDMFFSPPTEERVLRGIHFRKSRICIHGINTIDHLVCLIVLKVRARISYIQYLRILFSDF